MPKVLVVGIGNEERGDDAAGIKLLSALTPKPDVGLLEAGTVPESYTGKMTEANAETILLLDAVDFGAAPGTVALFDHISTPRNAYTTHKAPLGLLMEYLKNESGAEVLLLGIQPKDIRTGAPMSQEVQTAIDSLANLMNKHLFGAIEALRQPEAAGREA